MATSLEFASKDTKFAPEDMIEERLTSLMARISDVKDLQGDPNMKKILESWRTDLLHIRLVVGRIYGEDNIGPTTSIR